MPEYKLPDVGEGLTEAEIVTWKVKVGDVIAINDIVVEIETAKSLVELPSPYAGTVTALLVPEGEMVPVGTPIIAIGDARRRPRPSAPARRAAQADLAEIDLSNPAASGGGEGESLVGRNKVERDSMRRPRKSTSPAAAAAQHSHPRAGRRRRSSPASCRARPRSSRPTSRPCRPTRRLASPRGIATATSAPSPSRRSASWPRTSASTSPRWSVPATAGSSRARTCRPRPAHQVS